MTSCCLRSSKKAFWSCPKARQSVTSILDVLAINDEVLELDLTPNRSDCLSMLGVAYEVAALTGRAVKLPDNQVNDAAEQASAHVIVSH